MGNISFVPFIVLIMANNTQTIQQEKGKLLWKELFTRKKEPIGKQYSEEKDTRKSKQY